MWKCILCYEYWFAWYYYYYIGSSEFVYLWTVNIRNMIKCPIPFWTVGSEWFVEVNEICYHSKLWSVRASELWSKLFLNVKVWTCEFFPTCINVTGWVKKISKLRSFWLKVLKQVFSLAQYAYCIAMLFADVIVPRNWSADSVTTEDSPLPFMLNLARHMYIHRHTRAHGSC